MNISKEVFDEAKKRGLDWICTGGGFDYIHRRLKTEHHDCELTLSHFGESPKTLTEECEVGVAFHTRGYICVGIGFKNVTAALDFMANAQNVYFMEDQYNAGKLELKGEYGGLRD